MSLRRVGVFFVVSAAAVGSAVALDRWALGALVVADAGREDWNRALRVCGYVPVWLVVGAAMVLIDTRRVRSRMGIVGQHALARGIGLALGAAAGGGAAEVMKLVVRRLRPDPEVAGYVFRSFDEGLFDSGGLGFPSSHTAVAFGAAWALCRMHPEARVVWLSIGIGCGATRLMAGAHWMSDVIGAAVVSYAVVWALAKAGIVASGRAAEEWSR